MEGGAEDDVPDLARDPTAGTSMIISSYQEFVAVRCVPCRGLRLRTRDVTCLDGLRRAAPECVRLAYTHPGAVCSRAGPGGRLNIESGSGKSRWQTQSAF